MKPLSDPIPSGPVAEPFGGVRESWFRPLFFTLCAVFFILPLANAHLEGPWPGLARVLYGAVFTWILFMVLRACPRRRFRWLFWGAAFLAIGFDAVHAARPEGFLLAAHHLFLLGVLTAFVTPLVRYLLTCRAVTGHTIYAALCAYLLLAFIWALAYHAHNLLAPGSLALPDGGTAFDGPAALRYSHFHRVSLLP